MLSALLILASAASAADIVQADLRAATDFLHPSVLVGFNPQPDPPKVAQPDATVSALLLPAVQKVREAAARTSC